jgi:hypothetical protein
MKRRHKRAGGFGLVCLGLLGVAGIGSLGIGLSAHSNRSSDPSPVDVIAARFLPDGTTPSERPATYTTASISTRDEPALFNPRPSYPMMTAAVDPGSVPAPDTASLALAAPTTVTKAETQITLPANAPRRRVVNSRPNGVLNDAQIASIKTRLKLTTDQAQMWPAVEAALRNVSYTRNPAGGRGPQAGYVDPESAEVQKLKAVAIPLIMRLNDEQRGEVKMMAHVMGLGSLMAQF